ncbi:MAG: hypothetical protein IKH26_01575 [Bacteroidaceae bacterium]|nr:hypothetical protein [Bacteroidaceae bacterium]
MKPYPLIIGITLCVLTICSCDSKRDNGQKEAEELLKEARGMLSSDQFTQARLLIDSLRTAYPRAFDARREAIDLMNELEIKEAQHGIAVNERTIADVQKRVSDLKSNFILEKAPRYQTIGFYKDIQQPASSLHRTCLYAEVDETGQLFLVSVLTGKQLKHEIIKVDTGTEEGVESDKCFSFVTDKSNGYEEQATFKKRHDNGVLDFIIENASKSIRVTCIAPNGRHSYNLSKTDVQSIIRCNELESAMQQEEQLKHANDSLRMKVKFFLKKQEKDRAGTQPAKEKILKEEPTKPL